VILPIVSPSVSASRDDGGENDGKAERLRRTREEIFLHRVESTTTPHAAARVFADGSSLRRKKSAARVVLLSQRARWRWRRCFPSPHCELSVGVDGVDGTFERREVGADDAAGNDYSSGGDVGFSPSSRRI